MWRLRGAYHQPVPMARIFLPDNPEFDVFTDMELLDGVRHLEAFKLYPEFAEQYPDAVFILNTRDREAWIKSRLGHRKGEFAARFKQYLGIDSDAELAYAWREDWENHHRGVLEFFARRPHRFFVCRIDADLPDLLNEKIPEFRLNRKLYRLQGRSRPPPPPRQDSCPGEQIPPPNAPH